MIRGRGYRWHLSTLRYLMRAQQLAHQKFFARSVLSANMIYSG